MYSGLMMKKNQMEKVPIKLLPLLEDASLMRIPMVLTFPMMNFLIPMKKFALKVKNKRRLLSSWKMKMKNSYQLYLSYKMR